MQKIIIAIRIIIGLLKDYFLHFWCKRVYAGKISTTDLVNAVYNFCEVYSGKVMYPYQQQFSKRIIRSVLENDGAELTALFSRQSGKTETVAITVGGLMIILPQLANMPMFLEDTRLQMFKDGLWVGIFAPSQRQAQTTYNRMKSRLQSKEAIAVLNDPDFRLEFTTSNGQTVALSNGSFATAISASDSSNIEGESFKFIICEECFVRGTPILTEKGYVNIEDVKVGDNVYSFNHDTKQVELKVVQRSFSQPLYGRKIVTIKTKSGKEIVCTDNHKVFIAEKGYVRADSLQIHDLMLSYKHTTQQTEKDLTLFKGMSEDTQSRVYEELLQEEEIVSIDINEFEEIEVFDLTVEDNHNFFANGLLVHNCQDISNFKIRKSIHPMGAAYNATICKIGTATTYKGDFYEAIERNKKEYEQGKVRVKSHFEYNYKVVMKYNPKYERYIEREKRSLGETSDEFRMSYNLEWIISRGMFVDIDELEKNCGDIYLDRVKSDHIANHVLGIDIGGGSSKSKDADSTVLTTVEVDWESPVLLESTTDEETGEDIVYSAYNTYIKDWLEISPEVAEDYEEQYSIIMDYISNFRYARIVVDSTREASLGQRIQANVRCDVWLFTFSSKSKSEIYKHLQTEISTGRARFPMSAEVQETKEFKKFIQQLADLQKSYSGSFLVVSHPNERGAHDDYSDSWALALWGTKDRGYVDNTETLNRKKTMVEKQNSIYFRSRNRKTARRR